MLHFLIFFLFLFENTYQCISGCIGLGLCLSPPMLSMPFGCPCGSGFICMRGACVARAAGAKTFQDEPIRRHPSSSSNSDIKTPDEHFQTCCTILDVLPSCSNLCSYSQYTSEQVQSSILSISTCPMTEIPKIHFCASRGANHTECCDREMIPKQCTSFCDQSGDKKNEISINQLACVYHFNEMKQCFFDHATTEYYESNRGEVIEEITGLAHY
ncbi:unnamed protein product [Caenorhabditis angaria]|uniref:Domain of unknown function DB domain-containing protein n=1 Tax=Caenorhabditis angaria TaxID=860376 RepID=A0A9P1N8F5_9PELO|nr:unnamed protein product [Caenorhabditis angaria]